MKQSPLSKSIVAVYSPFQVKPSFVYPILESEGRTFFQDTDDNDRVVGFAPTEDSEVSDFHDIDGQRQVTIGEQAVYGFQFEDGKLILGTRQEVATQLFDRLHELTSHPFTLKSVISFITDVLPNKAFALTYMKKFVVESISNRFKIDNEDLSRKWLNLEVLSKVLRRTDSEGYINYWDLIDELDTLTIERGVIFIKVQLVRSQIGLTPKLRDCLTSFGFLSAKLNSESAPLKLDKYRLANLKMAARHVLVTEVRVPSEIEVIVRLVDPVATRKRYMKKDIKKVVQRRTHQDYSCGLPIEFTVDEQLSRDNE